MNRVEQINQILRQLQMGTPDIEASALVSEDGLLIASALPQHVEEVRVAGMAATLLALGTRASVELDRGGLEQVLIRGQKGYVVMQSAAPGTVLVAMTTREAKLGLIFLDISRAIEQLKKVL